MRGTAPGQSLTIHEWAGLWLSGERYRVGERVLLFLYSPASWASPARWPGAWADSRWILKAESGLARQHVAALAADPILGGKTVVPYAEFAQAVRRSSEEE